MTGDGEIEGPGFVPDQGLGSGVWGGGRSGKGVPWSVLAAHGVGR